MHQVLFKVAGTVGVTRNISLKTLFCSVVWQCMSGILNMTGFGRTVEIVPRGGFLQRRTTSFCFSDSPALSFCETKVEPDINIH